MIDVTTQAFLEDPERWLNAAAGGEPVRIARPGRGAMVLQCGGAYEHLYNDHCRYLAIKHTERYWTREEWEQWRAELDEALDSEP